MKLPVCIFDLESDMLCPSCQSRLDNRQIAEFDIEFSRWMLDRSSRYAGLESLILARAIRLDQRIVLVVKKHGKELLESADGLLEEIRHYFGEPIIFEIPITLRSLVRQMVHPATEIGFNTLYLPDGTRETKVVLRSEDQPRIVYSLSEMKVIASSIMGEPVLFEYQSANSRSHAVSQSDNLMDLKMRELMTGRR
ncbi:MAG: hypothetical protein QXS20_05170 [Candidatus Thorarchaeota archaeon]